MITYACYLKQVDLVLRLFMLPLFDTRGEG